MLFGSFDVRVDTPKTFKRGTVVFKGEGGTLSAEINVGPVEDAVLTGTYEDKDFVLEGALDIPGVGMTDCTFKGNVWGNSVEALGDTGIGKIEVRGTSISTSTGDAGGKPGGMYSGRWSDGW